MTTTKLTVRRLVNTGNYENTTWELTAELSDGDDVYQAAAALAVAIVEMARAEHRRRFPDPTEASWQHWLSEGDTAVSDPEVAHAD